MFAPENELLQMLTFKRPAGSNAERAFIQNYIAPLGVSYDAAGNLHKRIGDAPVLWSCHTDTVHRRSGKQRIAYGDGVATIGKGETSNCLGADDTAGVWLMREMIRAGRPGLYVFHRAEERGGIGSSHIADETPELLDGVDCAIALDRAGTSDIITHQAGGRCSSGAFALSLAPLLPKGFAPSSHGVFTDTANYTHLVPECTNLSVGYYGQHTKTESLDVRFLFSLRDALLELDTRDLTISRDPTAVEPGYADYAGWGWSNSRSEFPDDENLRLADLIERYPHETAQVLRDYGISADDIWAQVRFDRY